MTDVEEYELVVSLGYERRPFELGVRAADGVMHRFFGEEPKPPRGEGGDERRLPRRGSAILSLQMMEGGGEIKG
jgi:hypothetical protein